MGKVSPQMVFLCGPVTGDAMLDDPVFKEYRDYLKKRGFNVFNPVELLEEMRMSTAITPPREVLVDGARFDNFCDLRWGLDAMAFCDAIYLIPGWNANDISIAWAVAAQLMGLKLLYGNDDSGYYLSNTSIAIEIPDPTTEKFINKKKAMPPSDSDPEDGSYDDEGDGDNGDGDPTPESPSDVTGDWFRKQFGSNGNKGDK